MSQQQEKLEGARAVLMVVVLDVLAWALVIGVVTGLLFVLALAWQSL